MEVGGIVPEDAPDPRFEMRARLAALPEPVVGFAPQPTLEDADLIGWMGGSDGGISVSITYTLWRNPADHADPVNLADLDEAMLASLDEVPPWPRPAWIVETAQRMRYRMLWEGARTTWLGDGSAHSTPDSLLIEHIHHVHMNRFAEDLGWEVPPFGFVEPVVSPRSVRHGVEVMVDGMAVPGVEVDTDPFVYGLAADLPTGAVLTAVVPRDDLPWVRLEFAQRDRLTLSR